MFLFKELQICTFLQTDDLDSTWDGRRGGVKNEHQERMSPRPEVQFFEEEPHFNDARGSNATSQNVLFGGYVVNLTDPVHRIQETETLLFA